MQIFKLILFLLIVILLVTFILQNPWIIQEEFSIRYFLYKTIPISLYIILLFDFFLGAAFIACCYIIKTSKLKGTIKKLKKKIDQMEEELTSLRNLPITENSEKEIMP